jgi:hypothetical protein
VTPGEIVSKFKAGQDVAGKQQVTISDRSTLVLDGGGITIGNLNLDGALDVKAIAGVKVHIDDLAVENLGYSFQQIKAPKNKKRKPRYREELMARAFYIKKDEVFKTKYSVPGVYELFDQTQIGRAVGFEEEEEEEVL